MKERLERQARNESLIRTVNERIAALDEQATGWAAPEHQFEFRCECGENSGCEAVVLMTLAEYERVRSQRDRFVVVPGHENSEIERVVERDDRYVVVDKLAEAERFVE
jgi:diaminopimelate decarboxylase